MAATASTEARKRESFTRGMGIPWWDRPSFFVVCRTLPERLTDDKRRSSVPLFSRGVSKKPLEELAGVAADFGQGDVQRLLVEVSRSPAIDQFGEHVELDRKSVV